MKTYKRIYNTPEYRKRYTGIYGSWYAMKQRCNNVNNKQFKDYGGRGIKYLERWESFKNFNKDMQDGYSEGLTIERIDTNGNYNKENCRWATRKEQNNNKRCNHLLELNGVRMTLPQWAEELGIKFGTLRSRFYRGMLIKDILQPTLYR
jgi:hypothetical protein